MKTWIPLLFTLCSATLADDFTALCADRAAIERVYYNHRLGDKPPFEQAMPASLVEQLVKQDLHKEAALKKVYRVEVTSALLDAEVQRINVTTRAPEMLAELKTALGNDTARFARTVAKPIVVERLLRERFENDDKLHAPQRQQVEKVRNQLLAAKRNGAGPDKLLSLLKQTASNSVSETTWQLGTRPAGEEKPNADLVEVQKRFGPTAQILSSPRAEADRKFYFEDLPPALQNVLRAQLRQAGDVSAVIELPAGFALYLARGKNAEILSVATLSIPKRSYEQWLAEQSGESPAGK